MNVASVAVVAEPVEEGAAVEALKGLAEGGGIWMCMSSGL